MSIFQKQESSRIERTIVTLVTSGTITQASTPIASQIYQVRLVSTLPIWFTFGSTSAAANADAYLPANRPEYYNVTPGQAFSFVSTSTSSGSVALSEMS